MKKAVLYALAFLFLQLVMSLAVQYVWMFATHRPVDQLDATFLIVSSSAASVAVVAVFIWLRWAEVSPSYLRSRPWATLAWCCVAALGAVIPSAALQEQLPELPNIVEPELGMLLGNRWGYFVVGLLVPLAEELVFRGAILRALLRSTEGRPWGAIALSALFFALAHMNPAQMPHAFLIGLLLGWFYWRTNSIIPGVAYHWVNNTVAYVLYNLYPNPALRLIDVFGNTRGVAAAVAFSLLILLPALYQLYLRMCPADTEVNTLP